MKGKIINALAELKTWLAVGTGYANDLKYPAMLAVALKVFFPQSTNLALFFYSLIFMALMIFVGWFDLRYIKLHQTIADINTEKYNFYFQRLNKNIKEGHTSKQYKNRR